MRPALYSAFAVILVFVIYWIGGGEFARSFMLGFFTMIALCVGLFTFDATVR